MSDKNLTPESEDTQIVNPAPNDEENTQIVDEAATRVVEESETRVVEETVAMPAAAAPATPAHVNPAPKKSKAWIAWLVGAIAVVGGGVGAYFYFSNGNSDNDADHSDDARFENFGTMARDLAGTGMGYTDAYAEEEAVLDTPGYYSDYDYAPYAEEAVAVEEAVAAEASVEPDYYDYE